MDVVLLILSVVALGIGFIGVLELLKGHHNNHWMNDVDKSFDIEVDPDENNHS